MTERYQQGAVIPIEVLALDASLNPLTGKTDLLLQIRRASDDFFFDFNDSTFKSTGWTTRQQALTEKDATNDPGAYGYDWTAPSADDTYFFRVDQSPGTDVANVPLTGEAIVGGYVDDIDVAISSRSSHSASDVDTVLTASHGSGNWNETATLAAIAALNDLSIADVQTVMTNQGYTSARAAFLDAAISSRSSHTPADVDTTLSGTHGAGSWETLDDSAILAAIAALNDISIADVQTALTAQGYTSARAALLDFLDAAISSRSSHSAADVDTQLSGSHGLGSWETLDDAAILAAIAALNDLSIADVQTALTAQGYTSIRAALLDNLDAAISTVAAAIAALNDLSQADVQAAMTAQGYTTVRAALLDNMDGTISSVIAAIAALNDISAADVWAYVLENGQDAAWFMRIIFAGVAGISADNGQEFFDIIGTKKRIDGTVSGQDRIAVVLDGTP